LQSLDKFTNFDDNGSNILKVDKNFKFKGEESQTRVNIQDSHPANRSLMYLDFFWPVPPVQFLLTLRAYGSRQAVPMAFYQPIADVSKDLLSTQSLNASPHRRPFHPLAACADIRCNFGCRGVDPASEMAEVQLAVVSL